MRSTFVAGVATLLILAPVIADAFPDLVPAWEPAGTFALVVDTEVDPGNRFVADVPIAATCAIWGSGDLPGSRIHITGNRHRFNGCVHSNRDIEVHGRSHTFTRTVRHAGEFGTSGPRHSFECGSVSVAPAAYPYPFALSDYLPGGRAAEAADADGAYHQHPPGTTIDLTTAPAGIHMVHGTASVIGTGMAPRVTIVATGPIYIAAERVTMMPYVDGLLFYSDATGNDALSMASPGSDLTGAFYAPRGGIGMSSSETTIAGQLIASSVRVSGGGHHIIARSPLAVQHAVPGGS